MWNLTYKTSVSLNGNSVSFRTKDMWFKIFESHANACTNAPRCLSKEPLLTNITEYRTHFIVGACACCLNILWADITVLNMRLQNKFWNYRTSFVVATCLTLEYSGHRYHYNWHSTEEHFLLRTGIVQICPRTRTLTCTYLYRYMCIIGTHIRLGS